MKKITKFLDIKFNWDTQEWENLIPNVRRLAVVSSGLVPILGLFDDKDNFIRCMESEDLTGYFININGDVRIMSMKQYEGVVWC